MTVTNVRKDPEALTMTFVAELDAPVTRVWKIWEDPRQLERWWGPPTYPATFVDHDLAPGAVVTYFMTGPDGDKAHGWWRVTTVDAPSRLEFEDGFGESPDADTGLPTTTSTVTLADLGDRTEMTIESKFPSLEAMEKVAEMGMEEGMTEALGQIDAVLRDRT
jgi:uncharacterized protein YndB with AHSA1/START domain